MTVKVESAALGNNAGRNGNIITKSTDLSVTMTVKVEHDALGNNAGGIG